MRFIADPIQASASRRSARFEPARSALGSEQGRETKPIAGAAFHERCGAPVLWGGLGRRLAARSDGVEVHSHKANRNGLEATSRAALTELRGPLGAGRKPLDAFTLIELMLVLALLAIVMAIAAPMLGTFFRGRTLDSEGRRLLALTHTGQSRAVSEGIPMVLWVDAQERTYGLRQEAGWDDKDRKAIDFTMGQDLQVEVINTNQVNNSRSSANRSAMANANALNKANEPDLPQIRFLPDGSIADTSLSALRLSDKGGVSLWLARSRNRLHYEIRNP